MSRDFFIYHLNRKHVTSKMASSRSDGSKYGRVMAIYRIAFEEMATRRKNLYLGHFAFNFTFDGLYRL